MQNTCLEKYDVKNPSQNTTIHEKQTKAGYTAKMYITPSGNTVQIRGYEHFALDELYKMYNEDEIITKTKDIPRISYVDDKVRYYFPDIYIPKDNLIIEVKSDYTYKSQIQKNLLKEAAAKEMGYRFEFWIYNKKGIKA